MNIPFSSKVGTITESLSDTKKFHCPITISLPVEKTLKEHTQTKSSKSTLFSF